MKILVSSFFSIDSKIDDYWGSIENFKEIIYPFNLEEIKNKTIMEVGSGSGRILKNLLLHSPKKIISIEPSEAINIAKNNNKERS